MAPISRPPRAFAPALAIVLAAGCAERGLRQSVERRRHEGGVAQRDLDDAKDRLARIQAERAGDERRVAQLQERLRLQNEAFELQTKRLDNAQRENQRLATDLAAAAAHGAGAGGNPGGSAVAPASARVEDEPFRLTAAFVNRLKEFANRWPGAEYDARTKSVRLPERALFNARGDLTAEGHKALKEFAATFREDSRGLKLLVQANVAPGPIPAELERIHPTAWHLATYKAVNVELALEEHGIPQSNLAVSAQQFARDRQGSLSVFFSPPDIDQAR